MKSQKVVTYLNLYIMYYMFLVIYIYYCIREDHIHTIYNSHWACTCPRTVITGIFKEFCRYTKYNIVTIQYFES